MKFWLAKFTIKCGQYEFKAHLPIKSLKRPNADELACYFYDEAGGKQAEEGYTFNGGELFVEWPAIAQGQP